MSDEDMADLTEAKPQDMEPTADEDAAGDEVDYDFDEDFADDDENELGDGAL